MTPLLSAIERGAKSGSEIVVVESGRPRRSDWLSIHRDACALAGRLQARGAGPAATVALLADTSLAMLVALRAVLLSGAAVTVLAPIGDPAQVRRALAGSGATLLVTGPPFTALADLDGLPCPAIDLTRLATEGGPAPWHPPAIGEDDAAVVQLTSGTTGPPRQIRVSHRNLWTNVSAIQASAHGGLGDAPRCSWLPFNHDMGLVGYGILPMTTGCRLVLRPPADFLADPLCWPRMVTEYGGVSTSAPVFGYAVLARLLRAASGLDLSTLRVTLCGAEQIEPAVIGGFCAAAARFGLDPASIVTAYGLAEATVAVAMSPPGRGLRVDAVDRPSLHDGQARPSTGGDTRRLAMIGPAVPGVELEIFDRDGSVASAREVGEIRVRGGSVATVTGATGQVAVDSDGWLHTGDRGYLVDGELVVCGRIKDVIVVGGRTIQPEEAELACATVPGVRAGCVAVVPYARAEAGTEGVAVMAELRRGHEPGTDTVGLIKDAVRQVIGVSPDVVRLVPAGSVPKTTSGKLRRHRVAQLVAGR